MKSSSRIIRQFTAVAGAVALAGALVGFGATQAVGTQSVDETQVIIGEDGRTYGVPHTNENGEFVFPDMVRVRATNGNFGYIDHYRQAFAVLDYAETPEEIAAANAENADKKATAICEAFAEYYGAGLVPHDVAYEMGRILQGADGQENARRYLSDHTRDDLAMAAREGRISAEKAATLVANAIADGRISQAEVQKVVGDQAMAPSVSEPLDARTGDVMQAAEAFVAAGGLESVDAADIEVSSEAFREIYEIAQQKTAVPVPVYDIDGTTVVGEYLINMM